MERPRRRKKPAKHRAILHIVVFYTILTIALLQTIYICSCLERIEDLETQRDIYKARSENWSQRAIDDEEIIDQLQGTEITATCATETEVELEVMAVPLAARVEVTSTPEPTVTPTATPSPTPAPTATPEPINISAETDDIDEENGISSDWTYAGEFMCTAYCTEKYKHICGEGKGITASGAPVTAGVTVAADTSRFSFGTVLYIEGVGYRTVQDKGGAIKGNRLDVAVDTHANALKWSGYGKHRVWVVSVP